ncbi:MAG: tRNA uridine-5-carboxymethylaminomethyl(34) synthesis GTPase MnmE [Hyphomicrobiales bacterium]
MNKSLPVRDTIFAVATGSVPSGVAVVRISGRDAKSVFDLFHVKQPAPRVAQLSTLTDNSGQPIDQALALWFPNPNSFTGEDVVELHLHGSSAIVQFVFEQLTTLGNFRMAEAGEFTRRAFENGRMDLTEVEGLGDLLAAQTEAQRRQALNQYSGALRALYDTWRQSILELRAAVEADLDFSDEEDVPGSVADYVSSDAVSLSAQIQDHLNDGRRGEIIRDGLKVVLTGPPNAGKSSLLNALAQSDVAIVTEIPGTTRDVLTVSLNINDQLLLVSDTAGLRDTDDVVESEGIFRATKAAAEADLVLWLDPCDKPAWPPQFPGMQDADMPETIRIRTKSDLLDCTIGREGQDGNDIFVSAQSGNGMDGLLRTLDRFGSVSKKIDDISESPLITRIRHRTALEECVTFLTGCGDETLPLEIRVEYLRSASDAIGRILGRIDVEDILGHIFSEFCIGK